MPPRWQRWGGSNDAAAEARSCTRQVRYRRQQLPVTALWLGLALLAGFIFGALL